MHYLTVQDVLWIHLQIAKKPGKFSFANLEEATSYQYAYGKSHDVMSQAARFFGGFATKAPFDSDNRTVAFVAGVVFLELNGRHFNPKEKDLGAWLDRATNPSTSNEVIEGSTIASTDSHHVECRDVAKAVLEKYEVAIKKMLE